MQADWEALHRFYKNRYIPENAFLIICGDFCQKGIGLLFGLLFYSLEKPGQTCKTANKY